MPACALLSHYSPLAQSQYRSHSAHLGRINHGYAAEPLKSRSVVHPLAPCSIARAASDASVISGPLTRAPPTSCSKVLQGRSPGPNTTEGKSRCGARWINASDLLSLNREPPLATNQCVVSIPIRAYRHMQTVAKTHAIKLIATGAHVASLRRNGVVAPAPFEEHLPPGAERQHHG